jgi:hypothetical protein
MEDQEEVTGLEICSDDMLWQEMVQELSLQNSQQNLVVDQQVLWMRQVLWLCPTYWQMVFLIKSIPDPRCLLW